ncbi:MAG TPA: hypothetical protein VFC99_15260 [Acidimicrobiia bacterium]|nr:hypothetical protein [Acidimicrobiia bacterium]
MSSVVAALGAESIGASRLPLVLCFSAFIVTFVVTRVITRMIRAGRGPFKDNVSESGLHVHHAVPGIILLVTGAFIAVAVDSDSPWAIAAALLVGVGTSLVLDEFALILHLEDVYWLQEGRISVEMVSLAMGCLGLVVVGIEPFNFLQDDRGRITLGSALLALAILLPWFVVCILKGKYRLTLFGFFVFPVVIVGAVRLARPESRWARWRYGPAKRARADRRTARQDARYDPISSWLSDFVAGRPSGATPASKVAPAEDPAVSS